MAGTNLGTAYVQIVPSAQGIGGSIGKVLNGEAATAGSNAGSLIAGKIKGAIIAAGIGTAITTGIKSSLLEGSELEQNLGGTKAVFGQFYSQVENDAKDAYKNMGLSASDYMATANKMGSLFQGSGIDQKKSLDMTADAMQRAADVASVMGIDTSVAMESIAGAAKGNFTMMDNLGVAMNATTLQAYALEKGINFDWNTASNAEKAELAMQMFMDRTSQYQGNFARESEDTFSGSLGAMKAAAQNFAGNLFMGKDIEPSLNALMTTASNFLMNNLIPALGRIFTALPGAIKTFIETGLPQILEAGKNLINFLIDGAKNNLPNLIKTLMNSLTGLSGKLREGFGKFVDLGLELIENVAMGIIKNIPTFIKTVPTILSNLAGIINDNMPKILETGKNILVALVKGIIKAIPLLIKAIPQIFKAILDVFQAISWLTLGKIVIKGVRAGITAGLSSVKGIVGKIKEAIWTKWEEIKTLTAAAWGKIRSALLSPFKDAKDTVTGIGKAIKDKLASIWDGIKQTVKNAWTKIKDFMIAPIEAAKEKITGIIEKVKKAFQTFKDIVTGKFDFLSGLRIPHIDISGGEVPFGIGGMGTPPSIDVVWAAKGMILDKATLIGAGEAGREGIIPLSGSAMRPFAQAIASEMGGGGANVTMNVTVNGAEDPEAWADRLVRRMQLNLRSA